MGFDKNGKKNKNKVLLTIKITKLGWHSASRMENEKMKQIFWLKPLSSVLKKKNRKEKGYIKQKRIFWC